MFSTDTPRTQIWNPGAIGIIKDVEGYLLPPEAWTDGNNVQMIDGFVERSSGYSQVFGTPSVAPGFVMYTPGASDNFWLYASLAAVYGYDGSTHTDITRAAGAYTATEYRNWNGCILGGVPILNNGADVPQYWPTLSLGTDLANLTNWPATLRAKVIRNFGRFLVALNLNDNGSLLPHAIQWSHSADPGSIPSSWNNADPTVDAGRTHLTDIKSGEILDAYLLGNFLAIYKNRAIHMLRFIGGQDIFAPELLLEVGLLAPRFCAVIDSGTKHFCVGEDDIYLHAGTKNVEYPLKAKDRKYLYADMDTTNFANGFAFDMPKKKEVWFAYPTAGATYPNKALVLHYKEGTVSFRDFAGVSADTGIVFGDTDSDWDSDTSSWDDDQSPWDLQGNRGVVAADPANTKLWRVDDGLSFGTGVATSFLQRTGITIVGRDRAGQPKLDLTSRRLVKRVHPRLSGDAVVDVRFGFQEQLTGPITWSAYQTYNQSLGFVDIEQVGRLPAIEFRSQSNASWKLEGYDMEIEVLGSY